MFIVLLKFSSNKGLASQFMEGHKAWIKKGFDDGVFLLVGSIKPSSGGAVLAHNISPTDIEARVSDDPFVTEGIVSAEIIEIAPAKANKQLEFLLA